MDGFTDDPNSFNHADDVERESRDVFVIRSKKGSARNREKRKREKAKTHARKKTCVEDDASGKKSFR